MDICKLTMRELGGLMFDKRDDGLSQRACYEETCNVEHAAENGWNGA
jgi:hypothetical protein